MSTDRQPLLTLTYISSVVQPDLKRNRWSQTTVPVIRLSGLWLDRLGFTPEHRVIVTTMNKLLIIRLDEQ